MVWRKLPNVVLKQRQSIGAYRKLLQNQVRAFTTQNNIGNNNNNGENNNDNDDKEDNDNNLINIAFSMQKSKQPQSSSQPQQNEDNENQEENDEELQMVENEEGELEEGEEEEEYKDYLEGRLKENGDLLTVVEDDYTDLSFRPDEEDRFDLVDLETENFATRVPKNEKTVRIEFIKAISNLNPSLDALEEDDDIDLFDYKKIQEEQNKVLDALPELDQGDQNLGGEQLPFEIRSSKELTDSIRCQILTLFIKNYKNNLDKMSRHYINKDDCYKYGLLPKDYNKEYPPYIDRINGNIMVYSEVYNSYKLIDSIYQNDDDKFSREQTLRSKFFNDDVVIVSRYIQSQPKSIRNLILDDTLLFEQCLAIIHFNETKYKPLKEGEPFDYIKSPKVFARILKDTGLFPDELIKDMLENIREPTYSFFDNPSHFIQKVKDFEDSRTSQYEEEKFEKKTFVPLIQSHKHSQIASESEINFVPSQLGLDDINDIRGSQLKDQLSQYYLDRQLRDIPVKKEQQEIEVEDEDDKYKPIPAGYERFAEPIEDVLPVKHMAVDNFNPDFYRDFIQYRVLAMPHENLRMEEVFDSFDNDKNYAERLVNNNRIKRDEVKFFLENYITAGGMDIDFEKIQKELEEFYYKPININNNSNNKNNNNKTSSQQQSQQQQQQQSQQKQQQQQSSPSTSTISPSTIPLVNDIILPTGDSIVNNLSSKIGDIELNDMDDEFVLSESLSLLTDENNPSKNDDTHVDADLFLDSDETITEDATYRDFDGEEDDVEDNGELEEMDREDIEIKENKRRQRKQDREMMGDYHQDVDAEGNEEYTDSTEQPPSFNEDERDASQFSEVDVKDPLFEELVKNSKRNSDADGKNIPQYLKPGDQVFVEDMEQLTDSLFLSVEDETQNTITFNELDEEDLEFVDDNDKELSSEDKELVPFEIDFGKLEDEFDADRQKLTKEELLQSIKEEYGIDYYDSIEYDQFLEKLKSRLSPESYESLIQILETPESANDAVVQPDEDLSEASKLKYEEIRREIKLLNGNTDTVAKQGSRNNYEDVDEFDDDETNELDENDEDEDYELDEIDEDERYEDDSGIGFKFVEEDGMELSHPEGIQQFEDAIEEMELFDLMEGTYEEDLDLLRAEADMYVRRNEKKLKVLVKRRQFAKAMRDKQLEQNKLNPPVKQPYVIPTLPTGKNIYHSVLAPPQSYIKLQTLKNQPSNKKVHKETIQESYRALSSNAHYGAKEAEFAVKKIHKELNAAEGYKRYRNHSKLTSKPIPSPILSKPDLIIETEKLHDFNQLYRNN